RMAHGEDHTSYARSDEGYATGHSTAGVVAGLGGDDGGKTAHDGEKRVRVDLGARSSYSTKPALSDATPVVVEECASHPGIPAGDWPPLGELESATHRGVVGDLLGHPHPLRWSPGDARRESAPPTDADNGSADACFLPSGLSPSVPEFHRIGPASGETGFADYHRRCGFPPPPEHVLRVSESTTHVGGDYSRGSVVRRPTIVPSCVSMPSSRVSIPSSRASIPSSR